MAADCLAANSAELIIAGGMKNMTNAPYLLTKHRSGARLGHGAVKDSMFLDGLEDAYETGKLMGAFADLAAQSYGFSREAQDEYAVRSLSRANETIASGFKKEIAPVTVNSRAGETIVDTDEQSGKARPDKISSLKPAFSKDGTVTPANASSISDGAVALLMTRESVAKRLG